MAVQGSSEQEEFVAEPAETDESTPVAVHETCPGRTVFADSENSDAWIATDLTVDLER
jgi:hypothetical protein